MNIVFISQQGVEMLVFDKLYISIEEKSFNELVPWEDRLLFC